jgi:hypothetical protein
MAGVEWSGGAITRSIVADVNDRANGMRLGCLFNDRDVGSGEPEGDKGERERTAGFEKAMARRSSPSRP